MSNGEDALQHPVPIQDWLAEHAQQLSTVPKPHHAVFEIIKTLAVGGEDKPTAGSLADIIKELRSYALIQLGEEEQILAMKGFPDLADHLQDHTLFREILEHMADRVQEGRTGMHHEIRHFLQVWWEDHVLKKDQKTRIFLEDN